MERITVVKIGGNVIDNPAAMKRFLKEFAALEGPKILVHGGGKLATRLAERLELKVQMVDGRRITDKGTLDVVTMVYAGLINKQAVAGLQAAGCNALGLSGADGNAVTARRRSPQPVDYGFVGDIERVDSALLRRLLEDGMAPVFSAIMHDGKGTLLNCNADSVASAVALGAAEIAPTDLVFCFEKAGVLRNPDDDTSLIREITAATYPPLKADGVVSKGMIPKIENALKAVEKGVRSVTIRSSENLSNGIGTSGADGNAVTARRRSPQPVDYGFVGDIERVDSALLRRLLEDGMAPVFSAIMHDGKGTLLNCNADSVASAVALGAAEIAPTDLVFCFEKAGVLRNPDDDTSLIREITAATYPPLKADGVVSKGMIPKIENALKAVEKGVRSVTIRSSENLSNGIGTVIRNS